MIQEAEDLIVAMRVHGYGRWVYLQEIDCCICVPNKNGGTAFREIVNRMRDLKADPMMLEVMKHFLIKGHGPYSPKAIECFYPGKSKYLSIRHPVERFASLWRNKCRDGMGSPEYFHSMSPDELMEYIEKHPEGNTHWFRQSGYLTDDTECVESGYFFEYLGLDEYLGEPINASQGDDEQMPEDRIMTHYLEDYLLWQRSTKREDRARAVV